MPHEPRNAEPFKTQMRSLENLKDKIQRVIYELGTDPDDPTESTITWFEGLQMKGEQAESVVYFQVAFKVYYYPNTEFFVWVYKKIDHFPRSIDCGAAIYKWMHNRLMNMVQGLETIEEAFGTNISFGKSNLPEFALKRLTEGEDAPMPFDKLLMGSNE